MEASSFGRPRIHSKCERRGLRDLAAARQEVDRLKILRPHCPEDAGRALHELRAAATTLVDAIDRL